MREFMSRESESTTDKEFLQKFLALQVAFMAEVNKTSEEKNTATVQSLLRRLIKYEATLILFMQRLVRVQEDQMRQVCTVMGKYGSIPGAFAYAQQPTDNVPLDSAKWAFSSSAAIKDPDA